MMHRLVFIFMLWTVLSLLARTCAFAAGRRSRSPQKAILLVAFGTGVPEVQEAYDGVGAAVKDAFPGTEIRWAYTSKHIRAKLGRQGRVLDSPEMALARMMADGFTHVAVLSLHVIPGIEFHDLYANTRLFAQMAGGFERLLVARPLLSTHNDMRQVAKALLTKVPQDRTPEDTVVFMGHGSRKHPSDAIYAAMNHVFQELDANVFVATLAGYPSIEDLLPEIVNCKAKKAYLIPFMVVAGNHVRNDMAGDRPDSLKSILESRGIVPEVVLTGVAEYPEVIEVWLNHLREVWAEL